MLYEDWKMNRYEPLKGTFIATAGWLGYEEDGSKYMVMEDVRFVHQNHNNEVSDIIAPLAIRRAKSQLDSANDDYSIDGMKVLFCAVLTKSKEPLEDNIHYELTSVGSISHFMSKDGYSDLSNKQLHSLLEQETVLATYHQNKMLIFPYFDENFDLNSDNGKEESVDWENIADTSENIFGSPALQISGADTEEDMEKMKKFFEETNVYPTKAVQFEDETISLYTRTKFPLN